MSAPESGEVSRSALPAGRTPMAAPRRPDGYPMAHPRYRNYVLFGWTCVPLVFVCVLVLEAAALVGQGVDRWTEFVGFLGSPLGIAISVALAIPTLFFAFRFLRVGAKIPQVRLGPIPPAPPEPFVLAAQLGGGFAIGLIVLVLLSGVLF